VIDSESLAELQRQYSGRFWALVGMEMTFAERGHVVGRVKLRDEHLNYNEVVHGGVISSLIDSVAGGSVRTCRTLDEIKARPHATSDLHVVYLSPATGTELVANGRVVKEGRTAIFTEVDVKDDRGRLVARGLVTFVIGAGPPVAKGE
jgi:uncharacterized protein (TIGR00369 family)